MKLSKKRLTKALISLGRFANPEDEFSRIESHIHVWPSADNGDYIWPLLTDKSKNNT